MVVLVHKELEEQPGGDMKLGPPLSVKNQAGLYPSPLLVEPVEAKAPAEVDKLGDGNHKPHIES